MADNTDEELLDNPTNNQSQSPNDEITPTAESEIINPNQETENMEVHHHAHNPAEPHHKKNWKSYFWEFLMLFLAVFCGFLAEYQLEHKIEKERGRQYIESFYNDLIADTAIISTAIMYNNFKIDALSDLQSCYDTVTKNPKQTGCMIGILRSSRQFLNYKIADRTLRQLEFAGGFRLLSKTDADSIIKYQELFQFYEVFETSLFQQTQDNLRNTYNKVIDFNATAQMQKIDRGQELIAFDGNYTENLVYTNDKSLLNQYFNELFMYYRAVNAAQKRLNNLKQNQIRLINYFKDKYHFD